MRFVGGLLRDTGVPGGVSTKIVLGIDGSDAAARGIAWCARYAPRLDAEVVVVHAVELPVYGALAVGYIPVPMPTDDDRAKLRAVVTEWCEPLEAATVPFRVEVVDGSAARAIMQVATREDAELVVTGRRGRGEIAELVLGSTSHQLSHILDRPLVIVP